MPTTSDPKIPELWWSPSEKALWEKDADGYFCPDYEPIRYNTEPPDDAVRLVAAPPAPSVDGAVSVVDRIAGLFANTNRRHMALWLSQVAAAIREGREWPALEHEPVDDDVPIEDVTGGAA